MKYLLLVCLTITSLYPGELKFDTESETTTISYSNSDQLTSPTLLTYILKPDGSIEEKSNSIHQPVKLKLSNSNFYLFKIWTENFSDDNYGNLWVSRPSFYMKGMNYSIGSSFLDNSNIRRVSNLDSAEHYFKLEIKNYPKNIVARIALASLRLDKRAIDFEGYKESVNSIFDDVFDPSENYSELETKSLVRALRSINKSDVADKLEFSFISENPKSDFAAEVFISKMAEAKSPNEFEELTLKFLEFFNNSESTHQVLSAYISSELQSENYKQIISFMSQKNDLPSESYGYFANRLTEFNTRGKKQDSIILYFYDKAIRTLDNEFVELDSFTDSLNIIEKGIEIKTSKAMYLTFIDSTNKAFNLYKEILRMDDNYINPNFYVSYLNTIQDTLQKLQVIEHAILKSNYSNKIDELGNQLLNEAWEPKREQWLAEAEKTRIKYLKYQMIDGDLIHGFLKKTDETFVDFENLYGKPMMLSFFATWCGPCESLIPALEEITALNKDDNFYVSTVSSWELSDSRWSDIYEFLKTAEPQYRILVDETNLLPQKFGVTGLPTTIFVGKDGKISFIEQGFTSPDEFVRNSMDKIKFLSNK